MTITFSRHAKKQIKWRKISEQDIIRVVENPQDITPSIKDRWNYWENSDHKGLKITTIKKGEEIIVVTAVKKGEN